MCRVCDRYLRHSGSTLATLGNCSIRIKENDGLSSQFNNAYMNMVKEQQFKILGRIAKIEDQDFESFAVVFLPNDLIHD